MLGAVYANRSAINKKLITQIIEATDHPAAFAAFASIVFAPRAHTDFGENLIRFFQYNTRLKFALFICTTCYYLEIWHVKVWDGCSGIRVLMLFRRHCVCEIITEDF